MMYGSTTNSLCQEKDSDLDLTLLVNDFDLSHELLLKKVKDCLAQETRFLCQFEPM